MRIAILTLPLHTNYGGILQAYALQTVLERMGHDVSHLQPRRLERHKIIAMPLVYAKRAFTKFILHRDVSILYDSFERPRQNTDRFIRKHIKADYFIDIKELTGNYDAFIVGSDQIWRPEYTKWLGGIDNAYLAFVNDRHAKKISYAASFGTSCFEYSQEEIVRCGALIKQFNGVGVRESSGIDLCKRYFGINATINIDPTLLLRADDYLRLCLKKHKQFPSNDFIFAYILDNSGISSKTIEDVSINLNLPVLSGNSRCEDLGAPPHSRIQPPVEQWLYHIYSAQHIITDSYHALVFSIIFKKDVTIIRNIDRGEARINSLLDNLHICHSKSPLFIHGSVFESEMVQEKLRDLINESLRYLSFHLKEK